MRACFDREARSEERRKEEDRGWMREEADLAIFGHSVVRNMEGKTDWLAGQLKGGSGVA